MTPYKKLENSDEVLKEIGKRISILRKVSGLSREDLAAKINICPKLLRKYEAGKNAIPMDKLIEIAELFRVEAGRLIP